MDFILNSRTKKVEIFYESAAEQQAVLDFVSKYLTYKEDKTTPSIYINDPGISWTNAISTTPYTITTNTPNLSSTICLDNNPTITTELPVTNTSTIQPLNTHNIPIATCSCCYDSASEDTARKALGLDTNQLEKNIKTSIETSINSKEKKAYTAVKLDNSSDEGGYSCLTASVPRKTK